MFSWLSSLQVLAAMSMFEAVPPMAIVESSWMQSELWSYKVLCSSLDSGFVKAKVCLSWFIGRPNIIISNSSSFGIYDIKMKWLFLVLEAMKDNLIYIMIKTLPTNKFKLCVALVEFFHLVVVDALVGLVWTLVCELLVCLGEGGECEFLKRFVYAIYTTLMYIFVIRHASC